MTKSHNEVLRWRDADRGRETMRVGVSQIPFARRCFVVARVQVQLADTQLYIYMNMFHVKLHVRASLEAEAGDDSRTLLLSGPCVPRHQSAGFCSYTNLNYLDIVSVFVENRRRTNSDALMASMSSDMLSINFGKSSVFFLNSPLSALHV